MRIEQNLGMTQVRIGSVVLDGNAVLAPMSGVSDVAFRRLARRFGAALVVTEMVAADAYLAGEEEARLRSEGQGVSPHAVQLVGRDPVRMAEAARLAEAAGADLVDINLGCPAKRVTGGLAGSALMREPDLALRIIGAVLAAIAVPVTVKMRLGWDDASRNAAEIAARVAALGAAAVTVHGRTRQQFYAGRADWAAIAAVVGAVRLPVLANGDVGTVASARACLGQSGAAGVMIGRQAVGQPWLVGKIGAALAGTPWRSPSPAERADAAIEHYETLLGLYGRDVGIRHARKHLAGYADRAAADGLGLSRPERAELVTTTSPARAAGLLRRLFEEPAAETPRIAA